MKTTIMILLLSSQVFAAGQIKKFICATDKLPGEKFTFTVKNFGQRSIDLMYTDSIRGPFKTVSKNKNIQGIVDTLNGQGGVLRGRNYGFQLFGDQIGCDFVWINLEKNKGYKKGSIKAEYQCSDKPVYRDSVTCAVN